MSKQLLSVTFIITMFVWGCKDEKKAEEYRKRAYTYASANNYDSAIVLLRQSIKYEPDTFQVRWCKNDIVRYQNQIARRLVDSLNFEEAILTYREVIENEDVDEAYKGYAYYGLSDIYIRQNKYQEAEICARNGVVSFSNAGYMVHNLSNSWEQLGSVHYKMGRYEEMFSDFEKAVSYAPHDSIKANIYVNMADVAFDKLKDGKRVLEFVNKSIEYDSNKSRPYLYRAVIYRAAKMQKESCEAITKYISLGGNIKIQELNSFCP